MAKVRMDIRVAKTGDFPAVCICCGSEATTTRTKNMQWFPPWVYALLPAGLLPYAVLASIMTRRANVQVPFCEKHKGHWFNRALLVWGSFFLIGGVALVALVFGMNLDRRMQDTVMPFVCIGSSVFGLIWLVLAITVRLTTVRPSEITDFEVELTSVSDAFADAVHNDLEERQSRRRDDRWRDENDDYEDRPRPRRSGPDDAFER